MAANLKFRSKKPSYHTRDCLPSEEKTRSQQKCFLLLPEFHRITWYSITALCAFFSYANSLSCDLVHDDIFAIKENPDIRPNVSLYDVFINDFWGKPMSSNTSHKSYRPLCVLTFRLNFILHGLDPLGYHLINVVCHVLVCLTFVHFVEKHVWRCTRLAAITGVLFASHPIHTEAVTGVVGRADVLACFLFLLSLLSYIRSLKNENSVFTSVYIWCCVALGAMAMLIKEQGITIFGVCVLYHAFIENRLWERIIKGEQISTVLKSCKSLITRTCLLMLVVTCLLVFRLWMLGGSLPKFTTQDNPASFSDSLLTRVLTYCYLFAFNLWLLLSPYKLSYDWQGGSIPLVETVWDPRNLATIAFFSLIVLLLWFSLLSQEGEKEDQQVVFISLLLMIVPFLPASNLLFRVGFVVAERILYIPSLGFCLLVIHGANKLCQWSHQHKPGQRSATIPSKLITFFLILLIVLFCWKTVDRNHVWKNRETLFRSGVETLPHNAKVHYNYGNFLKDIGDIEAAKHHYAISLKLEPNYVSAYNNLGTLQENDEEAVQLFQAAIKHDPAHSNSYFNLGVRFGNLGMLDKAESALQEAIRQRPGYLDAMMNLAGILSDQGKKVKADEIYRQVIDMSPSNADAYNNYGVFLAKIGDINGALAQYQKAIKLNSAHSVAYVNMARLLRSQDRVKEAENAYKRALSIKREGTTLQLLGVLYYNTERLEEAERAWKEALMLSPSDEETLSNMVVLLSRTGRLAEAILMCKSLVKQHPNKPSHSKYLANVLSQAGRTREAVDVINRALSRAPDADLYYHHGNLMKDMNEMEGAKQSFIKALQLDSTLPSAHMNLGVIYHLEKNFISARRHYEEALKLDPDNTVLRQNLAKLDRASGRADRI
ncbi:protein O-mannosyl-transferase TMTC1 [Nematostella vectensis]|uniref:protein O-mannosyl-transferase TMTC1 n=1 Tax=Nematostella vectensis TaxID=45351 RepID=UPI00138FA95B|nr:protein O-mannosyl-transferase TMTC1 [Nematostella vectensis]